jgi:hypothetical protein
MDALVDLRIGNLHEQSLLEIYTGMLMQQIRAQFQSGNRLNKTCVDCDMYRDLELYRTREGRLRADLNRRRYAGEAVKRVDKPKDIFSAG